MDIASKPNKSSSEGAAFAPQALSAGSAVAAGGTAGAGAGELLGHLLKIEADAAALADEAQAEADRRISEGERKNRASYEDSYSRKGAALEAAYLQEIKTVKDRYNRELEACRSELEGIKTEQDRFSALMSEFLIKG
jgi:hypothetical protein